MKVEVKNGAVIATSETVEEAATLIKFTRPATVGIVAVKARGKRAKYATEEERKAAKARYQRKWYKRHKAQKEAAENGTPVSITKING